MGDIFSQECNVENSRLEMTMLARFFHWGRDEIWSLPVSERRMWLDNLTELEEKRADMAKDAMNDSGDLADSVK